jgi:hypothetical protein
MSVSENTFLMMLPVALLAGCANYATLQEVDTMPKGHSKTGVGVTGTSYKVDAGDKLDSVAVPAVNIEYDSGDRVSAAGRGSGRARRWRRGCRAQTADRCTAAPGLSSRLRRSRRLDQFHRRKADSLIRHAHLEIEPPEEVHAEQTLDAVIRKLMRVDPKVVEPEPERLEVSHAEPVALLRRFIGGADARDLVSVARAVTEVIEDIGENQRHGRPGIEREPYLARPEGALQAPPHDDDALTTSLELSDCHGMNHGR